MPNDNKTNLTNASVQESDETESSLQRQGKDGLNDSDENGIPWKNRALEMKEKYESVSKKYESVEKQLEQTIDRLAQLEKISEKRDLTSSEQREVNRLEDRSSDLERELHIFETDPQYRAARESINRSSKNAAQTAKKEIYAEMLEDLLEDEAEKREMKPSELREELNKYLRASHLNMNPLKRTKFALKEFDSFKKFQKEKEEMEKKKNDSHFVETDGVMPRTNNLKDAIKNNDVVSQMKHLGL